MPSKSLYLAAVNSKVDADIFFIRLEKSLKNINDREKCGVKTVYSPH